MYSDEFQNILQYSKSDEDLYKQTQRFSQNYLEVQLQEKNIQLDNLSEISEQNEQLAQRLQENATERELLLTQKQQDIDEKSKELEKKREQISAFAEKQILPKYCIDCYIVPAAIALLTLGFVIFIALQFFFGDKQWILLCYFSVGQKKHHSGKW